MRRVSGSEGAKASSLARAVRSKPTITGTCCQEHYLCLKLLWRGLGEPHLHPVCVGPKSLLRQQVASTYSVVADSTAEHGGTWPAATNITLVNGGPWNLHLPVLSQLGARQQVCEFAT